MMLRKVFKFILFCGMSLFFLQLTTFADSVEHRFDVENFIRIEDDTLYYFESGNSSVAVPLQENLETVFFNGISVEIATILDAGYIGQGCEKMEKSRSLI